MHYNCYYCFPPSPGRRLCAVRQIVEQQIIQQCGARPDLYSHYQHPLLSHLSPSYPPLFTRNVERGSGETQLGPGQISLKSLWPVMLMTATSGGACECELGRSATSHGVTCYTGHVGS